MEELGAFPAFNTYALLPCIQLTLQEYYRIKAYGAHDIFLKYLIFLKSFNSKPMPHFLLLVEMVAITLRILLFVITHVIL